jgi:rod shape-determining protein MreC
VVPRGLPVGAAVKGLDGRWRVVLFADDSAIDYVRILLFKDFSQLADQKALLTRSLPPVTTEDPDVSILGPAATAKPQAQTGAATPAAPAATPPKPSAPTSSTAPPAAKPATPKPPASGPTTGQPAGGGV